MGVYNEIKLLLKELSDSKVKQTRMAGEKLQRLLSQPEARRKLALEVVVPSEYRKGNGKRSKVSTTGARKAALSEVWNMIIRKSIMATQGIVDGKSKVLESDIQLPLNLIRLCDLQVTDDNTEYIVYNPIDPLLPEQQYYWMSKLDKATLREVFEFCMEMLENESALQMSELPLLKFLGYICSRRNYVAYFKPHGEICAILDEVKKRFDDGMERGESCNFSSNGQCMLLESSKIFENIVRTSTDIGIGIELFVSEWVSIISKWCQLHISAIRMTTEIQHLLNGLCIMISCHAEISIMPITRHGRSILSFIKKRYRNVDPSLRLAMNRYLLHHLMIGLAAGKQSGMMPGDLGDLGSASLNVKQLYVFLELVLHDIEISTVGETPTLEASQKLRLELFARYLSSAQRMHMNSSQWARFGNETVKGLMENFNSAMDQSTDSNRYQNLRLRMVNQTIPTLPTTAGDVAVSPFVQFVFGHLQCITRGGGFAFKDENFQIPLLLEAAVAFATSASIEKRSDNTKKLVTLLQLVFASADLFPLGSCWTSNASVGWRRLTAPAPDDLFVENNALLVNVTSMEDVSSILHVLSDVLEMYGGSSITPSAPSIRTWTILCLVNLTKTTMMLQIIDDPRPVNRTFSSSLQNVWRRIWKLLFKPNLCYVSATKSISHGSDGELVLILLLNIVRFKCVDIKINESTCTDRPRSTCSDSFLHRCQANLWTLPLFEKIDNIKDGSPVPFVLIYCVVLYAGLNDQEKNRFSDSSDRTTARKFLHRFCIQFIGKNIDKARHRAAVSVASTCVTSLCNVYADVKTFVFNILNKYLQSTFPTMTDCNSFENDFLEQDSCSRKHSRDLNYFLWEQVISLQHPAMNKLNVDLHVNDALNEIVQVTKALSSGRSASRVDSLPLSQARTLFESARETFYKLQKTPRPLCNSTHEEGAISNFNIPLSQRTLAVKVLLSLVLANRRDLKNIDWDTTLDFAASVFTEVKSTISNRNFHQEDLAISCSDIQGIFCAIIDTHTQVGLALPATFRESCSSVYEACKEILENFDPGVQAPDRLEAAMTSSADDVLMGDDSEDEFPAIRNKIPTIDLELASENVKIRTIKRAGEPIHSTRMSSDLPSISTRQELAFCAASLLLTLNPSYSECNLVAKRLVGLDRFDDDRIVTKYNVNLLGAIQATEIICSEVAFCHQVARIKLFQSNDYEKDDSSLPNLLCRIIQCVRKVTEPCSDFFLFGFRICAGMVSLADGIIGGNGLTEDESTDIINIVLCSENEGRFLSRRPGHRLEQLVYATRMFAVGKPCFRSVFGREFPRTVVLPSLVDVHGVVRRGACRAIAAVIQSLSDENSVVEAVRKRLPPILATQRRSDAKSAFRNWCIGKNSSSDDLLDALRSQLWEDSFVSFEGSYVQSMATILRHSSNVSIQHQVLFDLLLLASYRRTLQATIFQAVDQIAVDQQYINSTIYLDLRKKSVMSKWIESSTSLFKVSLLHASPQITEFLIRQGQCQELLSVNISDETYILRKLCVSDYLLRNMNVVVPHFFLIALQALNPTSDGECIDSILAHDYFKEIASLISESDDMIALKCVLKSNFASIVADAMEKNRDDTIRFLKLCLSEDYYERQMKKASASIFLHLIEQVGDLSSEIGIEAYFDVAQKLLNNYESNCAAYTSTDAFEIVGTSTTEVLILIKFWIDQCVNKIELLQRQLSLNLVVRIIAYHARTRNDSRTKLGFCIRLLLCIVADERLVTSHKTSFESLTSLVKAIPVEAKNSNSNIVKDVFYVVLNAHEIYQRELLKVCAARQTVEKTILNRSLGATRWLSHPSSEGDFWGWTSCDAEKGASNHYMLFNEHLCQVDGGLRESIHASFSLLQDIIDRGCRVGLETVSFSLLHSISTEVQDALFKCDARLCAQKLVLKYISNEQPAKSDGTNEAIPVILVRSKDSVAGKSKTGFQFDSIESHFHKDLLSGNQTVLLTGLRELQSYLVDHDLNEHEKFDLVQLLCSLCRNDFTTDVRILASQCLGEINVSSLTSSPITTNGVHDWISECLTAESVFDALKARCVYALSTSLRSRDSQIALTALWTIKDIQSSTSSINLRDFLVDEDTIDLVESICKCQQPMHKSSAMMLTDMEIKEILGGNCFSDVNREWCLDPQFWIQSLGTNFSFQVWIRKVVPALLVCLYGKACDSERSSKGMFFRACQRMSFVDPFFAEALFPVIIVDLLLNYDNNSDNSTAKSVFLDTWLVPYEHHFRCKLSKCFEEMLRHFTLNSTDIKLIDSRSIELLLNCLDLLRRLTQHRFDSSSNHRRNSTSRENGSARKSLTSDPEGKIVLDYRSCEAPWQGFPFGIVFSLDGTLVAESCLRCGRYSSAIFYLEMSVNGRHCGSMQKLESETTRRNASFIHNCQVGDISGYGTIGTNECRLPVSTFTSLLQRCYLKLGEQTAAKVLQEDAATDMMSNDLQVLQGHEDPFEQLQTIENLSHAVGRSSGLTIHLSQVLETAGLRNTLNTYLQGLVAENHVFSAVDQATIKEQWYSCQLFERQWNDPVFDKNQKCNGFTIPSRGWLAERSNAPGFYECLERSISALSVADFDSSQESLRYARLRLVDEITIFDQDVASQWSKFEKVDKLRVLNGLDTLSVGSSSIPSLLSTSRSIGEKKKLEDKSAFIKFRFPAIMHEIALRNFPYGDKSPHMQNVAKDCLIEHLKAEAFTNCELGFHKECDAILHRLQSICADKRLNNNLEVQLQKAALLESKNEFTGAIRIVQNVLQILQERPVEIDNLDILMIDALLMCGGLLSKHSIENASSVQSNYIMPASKLAKLMYTKNPNPENTKRSIKSLFALSHVAFRMFENVSNRVKTVIWQNAGNGLKGRRMAIGRSDDLIEKAMKRLQSIKKKGSPEFLEAEREVKELQVYRIHLEREINNTEEERAVIQSSIQEHRMQAMQSIVSALCLCGVDTAEDLSKFVFRLVSMWFSSDDEEIWNESIGAVIKQAVANVPTFRFVSLYPQLLSRLSSDGMLLTDSCQNLLQQLIYKMCVQHPYHCIVPLISVANGRTASASSAFHSKGDIAIAIVRKVKNDGGNFLFQVTEGYEKLATAYIHLAMADTKEFHRGHSAKIPLVKVCKTSALRLDKCLISGRRDDSYLPCILTKSPAIRPSCDYGDGLEEPIGSERIASFESYFSVTEGGLHRPKIVTCIGTKGGRFRELVKGEDETRQDAVMEQVFTYVNSIMARQRDIRKVLPNVTRIATQSNLNLVTYNIVPLSPLAGVLEWVEHAIPFGDFIADKTGKRSNDVGAHSRYYPGEWGHGQCRSHLDSAPRSEKRNAFDELCQHNSPVFRYFFVERFGHSMQSWYMAKTRYTRSVAVSNIVGHILGIGDRHTSNILVHQKTGEVVHIDFGIVFEQGKLWNAPEKVPFRLTRNVVDGMGPLGIEGVFRSAAETTLSALKSNSGALLTILSAIVADPLYKWTLQTHDNECAGDSVRKKRNSNSKSQAQLSHIPAAVVKMQGEESNKSKNEAAEHAIRKISEKLQGYEDGTVGEQQSVVGQISFLINSARDADNLSVMFPGWAPWV